MPRRTESRTRCGFSGRRFASIRSTRTTKRSVFFTLLAKFNETRQRHAIGRMVQHRVVDQGGLERGDGEAAGDRHKPETNDKADRSPPQQNGDHDGGNRQRRGGPDRRLVFGGEIEDDP